MWEIKSDGELAENKATGAIARLALSSDNLVRIKRNYKTVAVCKSLDEAKTTLEQLVNQWNKGV